MQRKDSYILADLLTKGHYTLDLLEGTKAEQTAIRRLWADGVIERVGESRTDSSIKFRPRRKEGGS